MVLHHLRQLQFHAISSQGKAKFKGNLPIPCKKDDKVLN